MFPVSGHADIPSAAKTKVTRLKELKAEFFQNKHKDGWEIRQTEYRVFRDILDAQIAEKKKKLRDLGEKPEEQFDFLGGVPEKRQEQLALYKDRIDALKAGIEELQEEKLALREERPLVWNIEFAEIFFDKGGFDIVIGNPPYVRKEDIKDPLEKIDGQDYKDALAEMVLCDFPREFRKEKLNAQSDLYTYFYIRSLRLLNEKGVHVFICSNSWLDVGYGVWLQKFLLNYAPAHFIFDNHSKRSFAVADVNTIISVIGAPVKKVAREHMVKFVAFKLPFEEVVFTENLLEIERARAVEANEKFRVYPITDEDLFKSGLEADEDAPGIAATGKYIGEKWGGKFLRAPDIFLELIEKDVFVKLKQTCRVIGYVHDNNTGKTFRCCHFIKSVKDTRTILLSKNSFGVVQYGVEDEGNSREVAPILFARTYGRDHLVLRNKGGVVGKEFYRIFPQNIEIDLMTVF